MEYLPDEYIDPKMFDVDLLPHYTSLVQGSTIGENLESLIKSFVVLPNDNLSKIVVSYMMVSQKWCKVLPIMFNYGLPGSGKSTIALLSAYLHNQTYTFSSTDTFPSIRNALDTLRWVDDSKEYERDGAILCWDNLGADTLRRDPRLYQLLLFGYNKNTDKVMIANTDGTNRVFHVFCPKIISSVEALHFDADFKELVRRLLIIPHKKNENAVINSLNDYGFNDFPRVFFNFWHNKENCLKFVSTRNNISRSKAWDVSNEKKTISVDLATTHNLIYECSVKESINLLQEYWEGMNQYDAQSTLESCLQDFLTQEFKKLEVMNVVYLQPIAITDYLKTLKNKSFLEGEELRNYKKVVTNLGYKLDSKNGWYKV